MTAPEGIAIGADELPKLVLNLSQCVLRLNDIDAASGDLGLRAINIERRQGAEAERFFVAIIAGLRFLEGFPLDRQILALQNHVPIRGDSLLKDVGDL